MCYVRACIVTIIQMFLVLKLSYPKNNMLPRSTPYYPCYVYCDEHIILSVATHIIHLLNKSLLNLNRIMSDTLEEGG